MTAEATTSAGGQSTYQHAAPELERDARGTGKTWMPGKDEDAAPPSPRMSLGRAVPEDRFVTVGSWIGGGALAWLICERMLPLSGLPWFLVMTFLLSLVLIAVTTMMTQGAVVVRDRVAGAVISTGALIVGVALLSTLLFVLIRGVSALAHVAFFTRDMTGIAPDAPLNQGGVLHGMVGTLIEITIATAITLPLGVGTAVFMTEVGGRLGRIVRTVVEAMTALPSVVAGLFIYTVGIIMFGMPRSGLAAGLALAVMMLPIIARAADVVLRVVPSGLREASLALGASRWKTVWNVVLPTARSGLATALILGIARGIGETSPVLITSGAASFVVTNPTSGPMNSLPLFIFTSVRSGVPVAIERGFGAAAVLLIIVLALFVTARRLARPRSGNKPSLLQRVRRALSGVSLPSRKAAS